MVGGGVSEGAHISYSVSANNNYFESLPHYPSMPFTRFSQCQQVLLTPPTLSPGYRHWQSTLSLRQREYTEW